jgi:phosphate transport system protein
VAPSAVQELEWMGQHLGHALRKTVTAYLKRDAALAASLWQQDEEVDRLYLKVLHGLRDRMVEAPETVESCTHLLFVAKNLERIGDHLTNVCEHIQFIVGAHAPSRGNTPAVAKVIPFGEPENR